MPAPINLSGVLRASNSLLRAKVFSCLTVNTLFDAKVIDVIALPLPVTETDATLPVAPVGP